MYLSSFSYIIWFRAVHVSCEKTNLTLEQFPVERVYYKSVGSYLTTLRYTCYRACKAIAYGVSLPYVLPYHQTWYNMTGPNR